MQIERLVLPLVGVFAILASSSMIIPAAYAPSLIAPSSITIVHVEDPSICSKNASAPIAELFAKYPDGTRILSGDKVTHGTQLVIEALLSANCSITQNEHGNYQFTALIEVRDSDGITQYFAVQQGEIRPWTESYMGTSWTPDKPGEYEVRAFSLGDLSSTSILSQVMTIRIIVV